MKPDDKTPEGRQFAELQQQWHGWGSPVGLGIALAGVGAAVLLLAAAWRLIAS